MRFVLTLSAIIYLIYFSLISSVIVIASLIHPPQNNWLIFSVFCLALIAETISQKQVAKILSLATLFMMIVTIIAAFFSASLYLTLLFLLITISIFCFMRERHLDDQLAVLILTVFALLTLLLPPAESMPRVFLIFLGLVIVLGFRLIFFYHFSRNQLQSILVNLQTQLKELGDEIFSCLLQEDYAEHRYLYEKRLRTQKNNCMQSLIFLHQFLKTIQSSSLHANVKQSFLEYNMIFDILLDSAQLRRRVTDDTVKVCELELIEIWKGFDCYWNLILSQTKFSSIKPIVLQTALRDFQIKIERLADDYRHILNVSAREPLVWLLWIENLKLLHKEMVKLETGIGR